ncbi:MAG: hemolysin family protein [Planctomycetota bacterium]
MDDVGWCWVALAVLTGAGLFFSVNAIALRIFSRIKLQEALRQSGSLDFTDKLADNAERLALTCGLYRITSNVAVLVLLFWLLTGSGRALPPIWGYLLSFIFGAAIFSVFSLAIPHAWAKYAGEKILIRTYGFLMICSKLIMPILGVLKLYDRLVKRLAGVPEVSPEEQQEEKQEEFLSAVEQGKMEGVVDEEEQEMIESVLELSETKAEEIMTPRTDIIALEVNSTLQTVLDTIGSAGHSRIPVYQDNIDNIIGLIYAKDLLSRIGAGPAGFDLRATMRKAFFVPETKLLRNLLHDFQNQKLHIAVVLDEYGGTAGIVTIEDILEELVGEITDEYEQTPTEEIRQIDPNTIEVDARMYIDDFNKQFEADLPEDEDYDTIGGFVFSHLGYIPHTGETFEKNNLRFIITAAEARKIDRIKVTKVPRQSANR